MDHYILTIYREDDTTPWIEVGTDPAHPRPYLHLPGGASRGDIDLRQGKALVGEMQLRVIDPQTGADQSERWITERLGIPQDQEGAGHSAINGRRAVLKRASGRLVMDGVVTGVTLSESFAGFSFRLRDIRERHRRIALFTRTGTASVLPRGVVAGYGQLPGGGWLIEPTRPLRATFHVQSAILGGSGYFSLTSYWRGTPIYDESATVPAELVLTPAMQEVLQARGPISVDTFGRYLHVEVWWRPLSGDTSWRRIPQPSGGSAWPHMSLLNTAPARLRDAGERNGAEVKGIYSIGVTRGLFDDPLPSDGQEVDVMVVYSGPPSEQYPFHWEGTAGEFLRNLYRGDWSDRPITTHVDEAALLALDTPIRIRLTEAPSADDSREWIESIYRALRAAPTLDLQGRISPVTAAIPPAGEMLPELTDQNCQPIPGWSHPTSDAVTAVAVTYERDYRVPVEADPLGERSAGDGLASVEVRVEHRAPDWVIDLMGEHVHEIDGWMFRALGGIDGEPATGDITDETGARVAERAAREILDRYVFGGQVSFARIRAADFPALRAGSWLIDRRSWRPNYRTGKRGGETLVQVMSVHEVDPAWLEIRMVDAGPADQPLNAPTLGTPTVTADGAVQIPVTSVPTGGEAAVYYAVGTTAPEIGSGAWRFAGRTDAPGFVLTPPQPDGATVWITARGEGLGRRPSAYTTPVSVQIPVVARVREVRITFDAAGVPTVHWVPGAHTQGIRVRWIVHDIDDPSPSPDSPIDVAASAGSLQLPATVRAHEAITADVEPWTGWTGSAVSGTAGPAVRTAESPLAPTGVLYTECQARIVDSDATTVTIQVDAAPAHAEVHLLGTVKAARLSGPEPLRPAPSGTQWVFERPAFQAGEGQAVFRATAPGYESDDDHIVIPEQGRDTVGLVMRASVQQVTATQITVRVAVADPQPGAGDVTIAYVATGGTGLAVSPTSPQTIPAAAVTSDLATTGYVDFTITRPEAGSGGGRVTFTATRFGRVADVDAVDVPELPPDVVGAADVLVIIPKWVYSGADAHLELAITYGSLWRSLRVEYQYSSVPGGPPDTMADYVFDLQAGGGNTTHLVEDADGLVRFWSPDDPPPVITVTPYEGPGGTGAAGTPQSVRPEALTQSGAVGGRVGTTDDPTVYQADRILFQHPTSLGFRISTVGGIPVVRLDGVASVQQGGTGLSSSPGKGDLLVGDGGGGYALLTRGASGSVLRVTGDVVGWGPVPSHTHTFGDITGQARPSQLGLTTPGAIVKRHFDAGVDGFLTVTGQPGQVLTWDENNGWTPTDLPSSLPPATEQFRFLQVFGSTAKVWGQSEWGLPSGPPPERRYLYHPGGTGGTAAWGLPTWDEVQNKPSVAITTQSHTISGLWTFRRGNSYPSLILGRDTLDNWGIGPSVLSGVQRFMIRNENTGAAWNFYVTGRIDGPGNGNVGIGGDAVSTYKLSVAGSVRATAGFFDTSDVALKYDIVPLSHIADPRALLLALDPVRFRWRATGEPDIGLVAQQTPEPFLGPDGLTIAYHRIVATLVAGWQNHEHRLRALELAIEEVRRGLA